VPKLIRWSLPLCVVFLSMPAGAHAQAASLSAGQQLASDQQLVSRSGYYRLVMQADCNLVLYDKWGRPLWATNTNGRGSACAAVMQGDANFVVYRSGGVPVWASRTNGAPAGIELQDDGNLVIYRSGQPVWASNTMESDAHRTQETARRASNGSSSPQYVRLGNRFRPTAFVHTESGTLQAGAIHDGAWSADWVVEPVAGTTFIRLRNRFRPTHYIHIERGRPESSPIDMAWWSAQWTVEPVAGAGHARLRNRFRPNEYLHAERGPLESGPIQMGWWSAQWTLGGWNSAPPPAVTRNATNQADDVTGVQVHLVYAVPSNGPDERLDQNGRIADQVTVAQRWLQQQVGRRMRFDTYRGAPDITFLRLTQTHQEIRRIGVDSVLRMALRGASLDAADKFNVIFYEGSRDDRACGAYASAGGHAIHFLRRVDAAAPDNLLPCTNVIFASASGDFRQKTEAGTHASTMIHEVFHGLGVAPACATDHDAAPGHTAHLKTISSDIMAFDGTGQTVYTLDTARKQYYGHGRTDCLDLENSAIWEDARPGADRIPGR
jgi:hypothetical protein